MWAYVCVRGSVSDWQAMTRCLSFPSGHRASDPTALGINQKLLGWECWGSRKTWLASLVLHNPRQTDRSIHSLICTAALKRQLLSAESQTVSKWSVTLLELKCPALITVWTFQFINRRVKSLLRLIIIYFHNQIANHLSWKIPTFYIAVHKCKCK